MLILRDLDMCVCGVAGWFGFCCGGLVWFGVGMMESSSYYGGSNFGYYFSPLFGKKFCGSPYFQGTCYILCQLMRIHTLATGHLCTIF